MHWYLKIPRFDGRKTLAFNVLVFIAACGGLAWSVAGGSPLPVSDTALYLLAAVAAVNGLLRLVTERPVWWRQISWYVLDLAEEGADETVYHKAVDLEQAESRLQREHVPPQVKFITPHAGHVELQRMLDSQLCEARKQCGTDYQAQLSELPLDADSERG